MLKPQLPASAVVTPWNGEGVSAPSQKTWASKCVWTSMNPGVTTLPLASMTAVASVSSVADRHDTVALHPDVGPPAGCPRSVDEVTAPMIRSSMIPPFGPVRALVVHCPPCVARAAAAQRKSRPWPD